MAYKLRINDEKQTIQGVHIKSKNDFLILKTNTLANYYEGWKPTSDDIRQGLRSMNAYDSKFDKQYNDLKFGDKHGL